ncbi:EAL domain-containing protein [Acinetobacter courvalinii]|jgi:EAL domain-containing protein (putative c-di-GMP-specific phosphodiesterase class I)/PAS domain-containing protein|uniref:EAL domain-containing protein n=1 Tax=Acinetobacter courvalinii TaxID=280147 RepID=UPI001900B7C1|nr:EAL domain-containing protein [Acinetobacter courvalinii]MBJ9956059.1 EAL domain-containing protein [Acinetobacter courvalinii]
MGSFKVRNSLLSKKLKRTETRLLIIDDNQLRYNQISALFTAQDHQIKATLLDDLKTFEKQLNLPWDIVIFGRAYDLKIEQTLSLIQASSQPSLPVLLLEPEDYKADQYQSYIHKGIYDILNLKSPEKFYISIIRALSYSRLVQAEHRLLNELEAAQTQAQSLVAESHKAVAILQEGIHMHVNAEYANLFGFANPEELIGLPILDVLQPEDLSQFKLRFKKISQGQFEQGRFELRTQNATVKQNPLQLEFLPSGNEDEIQLNIECGTSSQAAATPSTAAPAEKASSLSSALQHINRQLSNHPANANALVLFSLSNCPSEVFQTDWRGTRAYFANIPHFIKEQVNVPVCQVEHGLYVSLFQAESKSVLNSLLMGLNGLQKPQLVVTDHYTFPLHLKLGYCEITQPIADEVRFEQVLTKAFLVPLPVFNSPKIDADIGLTTEHIPVAVQLTLLQELKKKLDAGDIHLKYQQLYDKQDQHTHTYEVSGGFIYNNQWQDLSDLADLKDDPELSIQLDRWILVEACKQLHNFITQYPKAKLIVNLNHQVLLNDKKLPELVAKLLTIIGSKQAHPLILQFSEQALQQNLSQAQPQIALLRQHGAEISIRGFGDSLYSDSMLQQIDVQYLSLHSKLTQMLSAEKEMAALQEKILHFIGQKPVEIFLTELNDMNLFANAWNVEARFLQGNYFQKKLDRLTDVQDQ